jgi:hypothetical protein
VAKISHKYKLCTTNLTNIGMSSISFQYIVLHMRYDNDHLIGNISLMDSIRHHPSVMSRMVLHGRHECYSTRGQELALYSSHVSLIHMTVVCHCWTNML